MIKRKNSRVLLLEYTLVQAFYWMGYCCIGSYAANFMQYRGYTNTVLGLTMALANVGGFFLAPFLASLIDRSKTINAFHCLFGMLALEGLGEIILMAVPGKGIAVNAVFVIMLACSVAANAINTDLCFEMDSSGGINYGAARAGGSFAYAGLTIFLGNACVKSSPEILPRVGGIMVVLQIVLLTILLLNRRDGRANNANGDIQLPQGLTMGQFIVKNRRFSIFCLGTGLVMFASSITSNYLINIVESVGGNARNMGIIGCLTALVEVPMMLLYTRFTKIVRCASAIRIAVFMFVVRLIVFSMASTITQLYLTCLTQIFSYALLIPALVDYTSIVIGYEDMAKGQAVSAAMITLGTILANQIGGILLDYMSVKAAINVGLAICATGAIICTASVDTKKA